MASTNDFLVQLLAKLDTSSVNTEFEALKKRLANDPVIQKVTLDTSMSKQAIRSMASEIHNELGKAFKATGIESFDITVKDVESILASAVKESNKLAKELDTASSKAQKFLAQFNNKSGGTLVNSKEFKAVQDAINGLGNTHTIDDLNKAMNTLETTYNNMVSSLRNSGKSLNPFINAKNEMATMDDTIKGIGLEFEKLTTKPKAVSDAIKQLSSQQAKVNSYTIGTQEWADAYGKLQQMIQKVNSEISNLRKAQSAKVSTEIFNIGDLKNNNIAYMSKVFNTIEKQMVEINRMANAKGWNIVDVSGVEKADGKIKSLTLTVRDAEGALKKLTMQREKLQGSGKAQYGLMQVGDVKVLETASQAQAKLAQQTENANVKLQEQVDEIQLSFGDKSYEVQIAKLKEGFVKLSGDANEAEKQIKDVRDAYQELVNANGNDKILAEEKFLNILSREQNQLKINQSEAKEYIDTFKLAKLKNDIETWLKSNTAATKEAKDAMRLYLDEINRGNITPFREKEIRSGMGSITNDMRQMNKLGKSTIETFKQGAKSFLEWTTASGAVMEVWNAVRQGVDELKDLDDILTEISKTSNLTEQQLKKLGDTAFESASKYGKSASDYLTGVQEMYRAGFDNASEMAELSVLAQSAGDMETNLANDYLLATNAAYKYKGSIEELNKVLDSQNYITNNAAISMKDIADATTETASVAAQYGVQIDELSALIATATANTRESGSEVGTALKAILINLQDTTSKPVTETFDALGISMTKVVNGAETLKTPIELIHELADAYNSLPEGDVMRANILNEIGQKRHANTLASILSDMEGYRDMLDLYNSTSANDSAFREAQKSAENWSGTWNKVKNTWSDLLQNFANTDVIIGALNVLNDFIGALDKLGAVGTLALGGGLFAGIKNVGGLEFRESHFEYA